MNSINFKRHDGLCPYFDYEGIRFYIQDHWRDGICRGPLQYTLFKTLPFRKVKKSINPRIAVSRFLKGKKYSSDFDIYRYQGLLIGIRQAEGKIIIIPEEDEKIAGPFNDYKKCLEFSKKFIQDYIEKYEEKYTDNQISFVEGKEHEKR
ncbi:hypothetical protein [Acetobacterium sp.]|uniref:hypothetical protein n=1 Tax=Acetobacterium sp. TaxID=1872094 RepID=UPI002F422D62